MYLHDQKKKKKETLADEAKFTVELYLKLQSVSAGLFWGSGDAAAA